MTTKYFPKIVYGGDYNPEQWPKEIWAEDMRMFELAGIDIASVNIFSWATIQPDEITYDFEQLDEIMDMLHQNNIYACLATSTAAHPAWMAKKYPDVLRVDFHGRKRKFGGRHNSCPNSPTYRKFSKEIARRLAERYKDHPALLVWHVSNEYGGKCYCENCAKAFRVWLKRRYGTLDELNKAWNTAFWGHTFYDWDEIVPPNGLSEMGGADHTAFQGISIDYDRFNSDSLLECYQIEHDELKRLTPDIMVTTNMMGTFKPLDYFKWAKQMDIVSWDNYPRYNTPMSEVALRHDLMRGLRDGQPFMLMEQTPSQQNWQPYNSLKRPGVMRLWSYQAVARGADTVMFFQLRRSIGACEKYHGAVIEHVGHEHTRVFRECAQLGNDLKQLGDTLLESRVDSQVGIIFDWDNWWAVEYSSGPSKDLKYVDQVQRYYDAFYDRNIPVDMVSVDTDWDKYDVLVAPVLYMIKPGVVEKLERFVENGGTLVTTFFSGIVDERDIVTTGGYPGQLRKLLGIWAEEIDVLPPEYSNRIVLKQPLGNAQGEYTCSMLYDLIHSEGAEVLAEYGDDFYAGMPVITRNNYGRGQAWYVASVPEKQFLDELIGHICQEKGVQPLMDTPEGVEVTRRRKGDTTFTFILNHNDQAEKVDIGRDNVLELISGETVSGTVEVESKGVMILENV